MIVVTTPIRLGLELSELTEVPRTRVYDAIRVLEAQGLVEVQYSSPQQFRAVSLDEATDEIVLVIGDESLLTPDLVDDLNGIGNGVDLIIGALTDTLQNRIQS